MIHDRIIYPQPGGPIAFITPLHIAVENDEEPRDALLRHARQTVPSGRPFRIISASEIPAARDFRNAWTADFTAPDGYGEALP